MTDPADGPAGSNRAEQSRPEPAVPDAVETTELYETEDGVVLYDARNPLAWIQSTTTVEIADAA